MDRSFNAFTWMVAGDRSRLLSLGATVTTEATVRGTTVFYPIPPLTTGTSTALMCNLLCSAYPPLGTEGTSLPGDATGHGGQGTTPTR